MYSRSYSISPRVFLICTIVALFPLVGTFAGNESPQDKSQPDPPSNPNTLMREVIQNELRIQRSDGIFWRYRDQKTTSGRTEVRDVLNTKGGQIYRIVAINDQPLNAEQRQSDNDRIEKLVSDEDEARKQQRKRESDNKSEIDLLKSFPSAFHFHYDGKDGNLVKLRFTPNPDFHPQKREEQVFHHMQGFVCVDPREKRLAKINGELTSEVHFGGFLAHLDQGGTFDVRMRDAGSGHWVPVSVDIQLTGKALFFKTINMQEQDRFTHYQRMPADLSLQQAAQILQNSDGKENAANSAKY